MSIDKKIDYVEQDGSLNFIKNSESVTVPKRFKARKEAPAVKLAYITDAEAKMLKKQKPGTPHKGPKGIPSYDSFGSIDTETGKDTGRAGEDVSSAERGDFRGFEGSRNLPPGVQPKPSEEAQALRNQFIAAGGGQRVNPGFFDSRNRVSPQELALARASNPAAFRAGRRGGIMDLFTGGGILGNIIRGIGQRFGLGKTYDQPTYDMSQYSAYGLGGSQTPAYYNDLGNELMLSTKESPNVASGFVTATGTNYPGANKFKAPRKRVTYGDTPVIQDYLTDEMFEEQFGNFNSIKPTNLNDYGLYSLPEKKDFLGNTSEDYQITPNSISPYQAKSDVDSQFQNLVQLAGINETQQKMIDDAAKMYGRINPGEKLNTTTQQEIFDSVKKFDTKAKHKTLGFFGGQEADPMTEQEYQDYLISQGYI